MGKTILLNASPRKNGNTAQMLHAAEEGAKKAGAETSFYDLYDLDFTGCRSCLACKRVGAEPCVCHWKDEFTPILNGLFQDTDTLLIGSPIYLGGVSSKFHAVLERMAFLTLSYNDYSCLFKGHLNVGVILTMNAPEPYYAKHYKRNVEQELGMFRIFGGKFEICTACDTKQVANYADYEMKYWNADLKEKSHREVFPQDLEKAREMGLRLSRNE